MIKLKKGMSASTPNSTAKVFMKKTDPLKSAQISNISRGTKTKPLLGLIFSAIQSTGKPRRGASYAAIKKYVIDQCVIDTNINALMRRVKNAVLKALSEGILKRPERDTNCRGVQGSFLVAPVSSKSKVKKTSEPNNELPAISENPKPRARKVKTSAKLPPKEVVPLLQTKKSRKPKFIVNKKTSLSPFAKGRNPKNVKRKLHKEDGHVLQPRLPLTSVSDTEVLETTKHTQLKHNTSDPDLQIQKVKTKRNTYLRAVEQQPGTSKDQRINQKTTKPRQTSATLKKQHSNLDNKKENRNDLKPVDDNGNPKNEIDRKETLVKKRGFSRRKISLKKAESKTVPAPVEPMGLTFTDSGENKNNSDEPDSIEDINARTATITGEIGFPSTSNTLEVKPQQRLKSKTGSSNKLFGKKNNTRLKSKTEVLRKDLSDTELDINRTPRKSIKSYSSDTELHTIQKIAKPNKSIKTGKKGK